MQTYIAHRNFNMLKAVVLAALIGAACLLSPVATGERHPIANIKDHLEHGMFEAEKGFIRVKASFLGDGTVIIKGPLGEFSGTWREFQGGICLQFDHGPRAGTNCTDLSWDEAGLYQTSHGVSLRRVASVRRF